jgi:hypothetical protein
MNCSLMRMRREANSLLHASCLPELCYPFVRRGFGPPGPHHSKSIQHSSDSIYGAGALGHFRRGSIPHCWQPPAKLSQLQPPAPNSCSYIQPLPSTAMLRPSKRFIRSREPRAIAAKRRRLAEAEPQTQQIEEPMAPGPDEEQEEDEDEDGASGAENESLQHYQDSLSPNRSTWGLRTPSIRFKED